jgi:hypothetical protein
VRGQKNEFHALEKFYNYFPQSSIEEIDIPEGGKKNSLGKFFSTFLFLKGRDGSGGKPTLHSSI